MRPAGFGPNMTRMPAGGIASYSIILFCVVAVVGLTYMSMQVHKLPPTGEDCRKPMHMRMASSQAACVVCTFSGCMALWPSVCAAMVCMGCKSNGTWAIPRRLQHAMGCLL